MSAIVPIVWAVQRGLIWVLDRLLGKLVAAIVSTVFPIYFIWNWWSLRAFCAEEPTYIPPSPEDAERGSDGAMRFNCDGPGGALDYFYIHFLGPILILGCVWVTVQAFRRYETARQGVA